MKLPSAKGARVLWWLGVLAAFSLGWQRALITPPEPGFRPSASPSLAIHAAADKTGGISSRLASSRQGSSTHAASLIELHDGRVRAFWFSGSKEGAADVTINSAVFDPAQNAWSAEEVIAGRESTRRGLSRHIAKVGNPLPARAANGDLWLFYVNVSLGGWAGSSITALTSVDDGAHWSGPRRLITSPFINISTLVKGAPFFYADGSMGLPVYHEFISKFAEILRLDAAGQVIDKQRLTAGGAGGLQPVVLVQDSERALVLMRYAGKDAERRVLWTATANGGRDWQAPQKNALRNPDAALTALHLAGGVLLAVMNNREHGRNTLDMEVSRDNGTSWRTLLALENMPYLETTGLAEADCMTETQRLLQASDARLRENPGLLAEHLASARPWVYADGRCRFEFSYPYLLQTRRGDIELAYTWNRSFIKHVHLDAAWLARQIARLPP